VRKTVDTPKKLEPAAPTHRKHPTQEHIPRDKAVRTSQQPKPEPSEKTETRKRYDSLRIVEEKVDNLGASPTFGVEEEEVGGRSIEESSDYNDLFDEDNEESQVVQTIESDIDMPVEKPPPPKNPATFKMQGFSFKDFKPSNQESNSRDEDEVIKESEGYD